MITVTLTNSETKTLMSFIGKVLYDKELGDETRKDLDEVYGKLLVERIPNLGS
jgi:hypothetical protein